jgi:hypothetical protein
VDIQLHLFLISATDGEEGSVSLPSLSNPMEKTLVPNIYEIEYGCYDCKERNLCIAGNQTLVIQPTA